MFEEPVLLERLYFHELGRKEELEKATTLPAAIIVANFGVLGYFFTHFKFGGAQYWSFGVIQIIFAISLVVSTGLLCIAVFWCFRAVTGSTYEYLPGAETLRTYRRELEDWYRQSRTKRQVQTAKLEFEEYLASAIARCCQKNWLTNLVRSEELFRTKWYTVLSLWAQAIAALCYYIDFWFDPTTT